MNKRYVSCKVHERRRGKEKKREKRKRKEEDVKGREKRTYLSIVALKGHPEL